jgi:hypothetical protein
MEIWDNDDRERPIETYPGYLGLTWDGDFHAQPELKPLHDFDLMQYSELVDDLGGERQLDIVLPSGPMAILFSAYDGIASLLDQLPTVKVYLDNGPPDAGPASGGTCLFFIADGVSERDLEASIAALASALKSDFASLKRARAERSGP